MKIPHVNPAARSNGPAGPQGEQGRSKDISTTHYKKNSSKNSNKLLKYRND